MFRPLCCRARRKMDSSSSATRPLFFKTRADDSADFVLQCDTNLFMHLCAHLSASALAQVASAHPKLFELIYSVHPRRPQAESSLSIEIPKKKNRQPLRDHNAEIKSPIPSHGRKRKRLEFEEDSVPNQSPVSRNYTFRPKVHIMHSDVITETPVREKTVAPKPLLVDNERWSDWDVKQLLSRSNCSALLAIEWTGCRFIGDDAVKCVASRCINLTRFVVRDCKNITDTGIDLIMNLPGLRHLDISGLDRVTSCRNWSDKTLEQLQTLCVDATAIDSCELTERLDLCSTSLLQTLAMNCVKETKTMSETKTASQVLADVLARNRQTLVCLTIGPTRPELYRDLVSYSRRYAFAHSGVTDAVVETIGTCSVLKKLSLPFATCITDIRPLLQISSLTYLCLIGCTGIEADMFDAFSKLSCNRNCTLDIRGTRGASASLPVKSVTTDFVDSRDIESSDGFAVVV